MTERKQLHREWNAMEKALGKIKSIFFNLAEDRRVNSEELDDFNDAMQRAWDEYKDYNESLESTKTLENQLLRSIDESAIREKKLMILCEVLGMHPNGIDRWIDYPLRFVTIINSQLRKKNQPIYSEEYFQMIEHRFRWFNAMIERDMDSIRTAQIIKKTYTNGNEKIKKEALNILNLLREEIGYLEDDIKNGKDAKELKSKIINHWYEQLSADNIKVG